MRKPVDRLLHVLASVAIIAPLLVNASPAQAEMTTACTRTIDVYDTEVCDIQFAGWPIRIGGEFTRKPDTLQPSKTDWGVHFEVVVHVAFWPQPAYMECNSTAEDEMTEGADCAFGGKLGLPAGVGNSFVKLACSAHLHDLRPIPPRPDPNSAYGNGSMSCSSGG